MSGNNIKISIDRLEEIIDKEFNNILNEADPSSAIVQTPDKGSVTDIYQKAISALNLWIGARWIPSQKTARWEGESEKNLGRHVRDLFRRGNVDEKLPAKLNKFAKKIFERALRVPVAEIPAYYSQREAEKRDKEAEKMKTQQKQKDMTKSYPVPGKDDLPYKKGAGGPTPFSTKLTPGGR